MNDLKQREFIFGYDSKNGAVNIKAGSVTSGISFVEGCVTDVDVVVNGINYTLPLDDFIDATVVYTPVPQWAQDAAQELSDMHGINKAEINTVARLITFHYSNREEQ